MALLLLNGACFGVYYRTRRLVLPHALTPTTVREARIEATRHSLPGGWIGAVGPFILLAACAGYLEAHWQQIPPRLALHWGINGRANLWAARSFATVFSPLLIAAITLLSTTLLRYGIAHWLRPIYSDGLKGRQEFRFRSATSLMLLAIEFWIAALCAFLAIRPLLPAALQHPPALLILLPGVLAITVTAVMMWFGQGGSRTSAAPREETDSARPVGDRTEDRFWKLGVFYFNPEDPSVIVEKRFGIGYTVNFARPAAWAILLIPLLAACRAEGAW